MICQLQSAFRILATCLGSVLTLAATSAQAPVEPLLQKYCLSCHNDNDKEAGLSLQTFESLKRGGENGPVLNTADLQKSLLLEVLAAKGDRAMPPEGEPQPTDEERQRLKQWVLSGAAMKPIAGGIPDVKRIAPFKQATAALLASAMTADKNSVAVAGVRHVSLLSVESGEKLWTTSLEQGKVSGLSVGHQNPWIVAAAGTPGVNGTAVILAAADGKILKTLSGHTDAVYAAVLNSTDTLLATAGYDRRILIHDVATGKVLQTLDGHNGSVFSLSFSPTGEVLCSASADGTVKVWNVKSGVRLDTLSQPQAEQYTVIVSHDGKQVFAAGADNRIRVWKLLSRDQARINPLLTSRFAHEQPISRLTLSDDGSLLASAAEDGTIRTWSTAPLTPLQSLPQQDVSVTSLSFIDHERLFITRLDGSTQTLPLHPASATPAPAVTENPTHAASVQPPTAMIDAAEADAANDEPATAQVVALPAKVTGVIRPDEGNDRDVDCYRFVATAGQQLLMEVKAERDKSPLDSKIEVLKTDGKPILQTRLQAVRDSYFTFRGKDSTTSDDFRVFNWQEMELNEYLYADGEVVRLWLYPRGPDSGYKVYPGFGDRHTYFGTTATSHALQAPCFVVVPRGPDEQLTANGLPVFPVYYENDDDGRRELGSDSRLMFTAPADGDYVVRVSDARGFSGPDYKYQLSVRSPQPDYSVTASTTKINVAANTGSEITFTATRIDGYEGPIIVDVEHLPAGFGFSGPIEIQPNQLLGFGTLFATPDAKEPSAEELAKIQFIAHAEGSGMLGEAKPFGKLEELKLVAEPKLRVTITKSAAQDQATAEDKTVGLVLQIRPGETVQASLELQRLNHDGVVSLGKEDAGRNLPHGVFVDNIGLNGLLLLEKQSQRDFFITAAKWVPPSRTTFFLKSNVSEITSLPVTLEVLPAANADDSAAALTAVKK
jgi:cytochrome c551/c552